MPYVKSVVKLCHQGELQNHVKVHDTEDAPDITTHSQVC